MVSSDAVVRRASSNGHDGRSRVGGLERLASATIRRDQQANAGRGEKATVDGPLRLASHEAAGKDVDSLEEPDTPHEQSQGAGDIQRDPHSSPEKRECPA